MAATKLTTSLELLHPKNGPRGVSDCFRPGIPIKCLKIANLIRFMQIFGANNRPASWRAATLANGQSEPLWKLIQRTGLLESG
ncbi:unnamed protein product [Protopolystoma xenopodis]|uniref:Uncharacterized protein n=1 Tax=Protopolystoma xenopodis TaxID=117903 RepID=A0A448WVR3_9PLAT|nr:unnamed protein product [Protopolystoma xenopodis]